LAEKLDAHRKRVQAQHGLTLTGLYNVLKNCASSRGGRPPAAATPAPIHGVGLAGAGGSAGIAAPEDGRTWGVALTEKEKRRSSSETRDHRPAA
jgi:hypothetical protein